MKKVKQVLMSVSLSTLLAPSYSLGQSANSGNLMNNNTSGFTYMNKNECLERNKGPDGTPNDTIRMICDSISYPQTKQEIESNEKFIRCKMNGGCDSKGNLLYPIEEPDEKVYQPKVRDAGIAHSLSFICKNMTCVQQYLGIGYVVAQSSGQLIYSNYEEEFACSVSGYIYHCTSRNINSWHLHF
jgi:hypothetical protein